LIACNPIKEVKYIKLRKILLIEVSNILIKTLLLLL